MNHKLFDGFAKREATDTWFKEAEILCGFCGKPSECEISIGFPGQEKECCNACDEKFQAEEQVFHHREKVSRASAVLRRALRYSR